MYSGGGGTSCAYEGEPTQAGAPASTAAIFCLSARTADCTVLCPVGDNVEEALPMGIGFCTPGPSCDVA